MKVTALSAKRCSPDDAEFITGRSKNIILGVDTEAPIPTCTFADPGSEDVFVDGGTMIVRSEDKMVDSGFSFNIEVCL
jgi:hypothetical protein